MLPNSAKQRVFVHPTRRIKSLMGKELGKSFRWRRKRFEIARQLNFHILCVSIFLFRHAAWIGFMMARLTSIGGCIPYYRSLRPCVAIFVLGLPSTALSGPFAESGDPFLRHDLQLLRDTGKIDFSISTWPLSLGGLHANLHSLQLDDSTSRSTAATLARTRAESVAARRPAAGPARVRCRRCGTCGAPSPS